MVCLMLQFERISTLIESFVTLVMKTRDFDGRREQSNGEGQQKSHRGSHPRPCVSGGLGCPRRSGKESFYFSFGWHGQSVCLMGVWPRMGVLGERMRKEPYATLSWNQPLANFKAKRRLHILICGDPKLCSSIRLVYIIKGLQVFSHSFFFIFRNII